MESRWYGYTRDEKQMIKEIAVKVIERQKLTDAEIEFINDKCFHAERSEIERDGQDLSYGGTHAFSEFIAFLMSLDE